MPYTAKQTSELQAERTDDPLARGYAGMTNAQFLASMNAEDRDNPRTSMSSGEVFEAIDGAEFVALNNANKARVDRVLGLGANVIIGPGNAHQAVQELLAAFGGGSSTVAALAAVRDRKFSRTMELGLPVLKITDVQGTS